MRFSKEGFFKVAPLDGYDRGLLVIGPNNSEPVLSKTAVIHTYFRLGGWSAIRDSITDLS